MGWAWNATTHGDLRIEHAKYAILHISHGLLGTFQVDFRHERGSLNLERAGDGDNRLEP
jgi:hypothetical protein